MPTPPTSAAVANLAASAPTLFIVLALLTAGCCTVVCSGYMTFKISAQLVVVASAAASVEMAAALRFVPTGMLMNFSTAVGSVLSSVVDGLSDTTLNSMDEPSTMSSIVIFEGLTDADGVSRSGSGTASDGLLSDPDVDPMTDEVGCEPYP